MESICLSQFLTEVNFKYIIYTSYKTVFLTGVFAKTLQDAKEALKISKKHSKQFENIDADYEIYLNKDYNPKAKELDRKYKIVYNQARGDGTSYQYISSACDNLEEYIQEEREFATCEARIKLLQKKTEQSHILHIMFNASYKNKDGLQKEKYDRYSKVTREIVDLRTKSQYKKVLANYNL